MSVINPTYLSPLFHTSTGHLLLVVGSVAMCLGSVILNKMVSFKA